MNIKSMATFTLFLVVVSVEAKEMGQSCREFKELMSSGNQLLFLRSDITRNNSSWKAVICLQCTDEKRSNLIRVTDFKEGKVDWHYSDKYFLEIDETIANDDNSQLSLVSVHSLINQIKKTCKAYLEPINEGSLLTLIGKEQCARHEYLRLYLQRKYKLTDNSYLELESKKDLASNEFIKYCQDYIAEASSQNTLSKTFSNAVLTVKKVVGLALGEFDPKVALDSKNSSRDIATEKQIKPAMPSK